MKQAGNLGVVLGILRPCDEASKAAAIGRAMLRNGVSATRGADRLRTASDGVNFQATDYVVRESGHAPSRYAADIREPSISFPMDSPQNSKGQKPQGSSERKPSQGGSFVWYLIGLGVLLLLLLTVFASTGETQLAWSDLERLIRASDANDPDSKNSIEVTDHSSTRCESTGSQTSKTSSSGRGK